MAIEVRNDISPYAVGALAYGASLGEYRQRQQELANRDALQWAQLEQQDLAQQRSIAAQQQAQMFQHQAGQQDAYQRAMMGEQFAQNQYGRQWEMDQNNFAQQQELMQLQDNIRRGQIPFELNEQGKAKKAYWDQQETAINEWARKKKLDTNDPRVQGLYDQVMAGRLGTNWDMFRGKEPLDVDKAWAERTKTLEDGRIMAFDESGTPSKIFEKMPTLQEANASREKMQKEELANKIELERIKSREKYRTELDSKYEKEQERRDKAYESAYSSYLEATVTGEDGKPKARYEPEEAARLAREEAGRRVPDSRVQQEQLEEDFDRYRDWWESQPANKGQQIPDLDEMTTRERRAVLRELKEFKARTQPSAPQGDDAFRSEWDGAEGRTVPWDDLPPELKQRAREVMQGGAVAQPQEIPKQVQIAPQELEVAANSAKVITTQEEFDALPSGATFIGPDKMLRVKP